MLNPSIWLATARSTQFPSLNGDAAADVVVIGGGITGITAALLLSRAGKTVIVLESGSVGGGTTGHSTGNLYAVAGAGLAEIERRWDTHVTKLVAKSRAEAMDRIEALVREHGIECGFARRALHRVGLDDSAETARQLEAEHAACVRAGLPACLQRHSPLPFASGPALVIDGQAQFHPLAYTRALAQRIGSEHCRIYENTHVARVEAEEGRVLTDRGTVTAEAIVMATHTPKGFNVVQTELGPYREYAVAAQMLSGSFPPGIFWTLEDSRHSLRHFEHEGRQFVMVVGERHKGGQQPDTQACYETLERYMRERVGLAPVVYRWSAQGYYPADGLPYIGRSAASETLYVATGFAADGLTYGTVAAQMIHDELLGHGNPYFDVYKATRLEPARAAKRFIQENADTVGEYIRDYVKLLRPRSLADLAPGDGRIVEVDGRRCGVHRTAQGELLAVSPVCTHLKCIVHWNGAEQTWDCPCHGSRFRPDGSVIEGPALAPLDCVRLGSQRKAA